jgi:hypothetical protein
MKLKIFLAIAAIGIIAACSSPYRATNTTVVVAPDNIRSSFTTQYPTATNVVWYNYDAPIVVPIDWDLTGWSTLDQGDYIVRFDMDNENYYAWYDDTGTWIGSAYVVRDITTIPAEINTLVANKYSGYSIASVNREFHKDRVLYEVELKNNDAKVKMLVDGQGNVIKEKSKPLN